MSNKKIKYIILLMILPIFFTPLTHATQSRLINFQGRLTDQQGNTLDGTYNIIFSIYSSATDTDPLWTEEHMDVSVSKGLVNVLLGSITSLDIPTKVTFDQERYLGIRIDADNNPVTIEPEMFPRQMILPAIYAYNADKLDGKDGSEYTTPTTDAGRDGIVDDLYEGNTKLEDKYLRKEAKAVDADKLDGYDSSAFLIKAHGGTLDGDLNITSNVGIGTTSPTRRLHIFNSTAGYQDSYGKVQIDSGAYFNGQLRLVNTYSGDPYDETSIGFIGKNNRFWVIGAGAGAGAISDKFGIAYGEGNPDRNAVRNLITIINNGNVGIGTTNPEEKLHVNGNMKITNGTFILSGPTVSSPSYGGAGGLAFSYDCPAGYVVTGIRGNSGTYVDRIQVVCKKL